MLRLREEERREEGRRVCVAMGKDSRTEHVYK